MRIRVTDRRGIHDRHGVAHALGDEFDIRDDIAVKYLRIGRAEAVREAPVERAVVAPPSENTAKRVGNVAKRKAKGGARKGSFSPEKE